MIIFLNFSIISIMTFTIILRRIMSVESLISIKENAAQRTPGAFFILKDVIQKT